MPAKIAWSSAVHSNHGRSAENCITFTSAYAPTGTAGANDYFEVTGVQLEEGQSASEFEFIPVQQDRDRCERFYEKTYFPTSAPGAATSNGMPVFPIPATASNVRICQPFRTRKRVFPTLTTWDAAGTSARQTTYTFGGGVQTDGVNAATFITPTDTQIVSNIVSGSLVSLGFHYAADAEL